MRRVSGHDTDQCDANCNIILYIELSLQSATGAYGSRVTTAAGHRWKRVDWHHGIMIITGETVRCLVAINRFCCAYAVDEFVGSLEYITRYYCFRSAKSGLQKIRKSRHAVVRRGAGGNLVFGVRGGVWKVKEREDEGELRRIWRRRRRLIDNVCRVSLAADRHLFRKTNARVDSFFSFVRKHTSTYMYEKKSREIFSSARRGKKINSLTPHGRVDVD